MTEITATKTGKNHFTLEVKNHAENRDACVMVSALVQTLLGALLNNDMATLIKADLEDGHALIDYLADDITSEEDMYCILIGLMQVRNTYPNDVVLIENIFIHE